MLLINKIEAQKIQEEYEQQLFEGPEQKYEDATDQYDQPASAGLEGIDFFGGGESQQPVQNDNTSQPQSNNLNDMFGGSSTNANTNENVDQFFINEQATQQPAQKNDKINNMFASDANDIFGSNTNDAFNTYNNPSNDYNQYNTGYNMQQNYGMNTQGYNMNTQGYNMNAQNNFNTGGKLLNTS